MFQEEKESIKLENLGLNKVKKEKAAVSESSGQIKYSNSSYIVVQDEFLIAGMTDRINEMIIYEEPSEIDISEEPAQIKCLTAIAEETSSLTCDENSFKKKSTGHSFEIRRTWKKSQQNKVRLLLKSSIQLSI